MPERVSGNGVVLPAAVNCRFRFETRIFSIVVQQPVRLEREQVSAIRLHRGEIWRGAQAYRLERKRTEGGLQLAGTRGNAARGCCDPRRGRSGGLQEMTSAQRQFPSPEYSSSALNDRCRSLPMASYICSNAFAASLLAMWSESGEFSTILGHERKKMKQSTSVGLILLGSAMGLYYYDGGAQKLQQQRYASLEQCVHDWGDPADCTHPSGTLRSRATTTDHATTGTRIPVDRLRLPPTAAPAASAMPVSPAPALLSGDYHPRRFLFPRRLRFIGSRLWRGRLNAAPDRRSARRSCTRNLKRKGFPFMPATAIGRKMSAIDST